MARTPRPRSPDAGYVRITPDSLTGGKTAKEAKARALNGPRERGFVKGHDTIDNMKHRFIEHVHIDKNDCVPARVSPVPPGKVPCADTHGFSLHGAARCGADQRGQLEPLCRYITRPALANERPSRNAKEQVVLRLESPTRDGTTRIVMHPQQFMQRLAALVQRPRRQHLRGFADDWHSWVGVRQGRQGRSVTPFRLAGG